MFEQAFYSHKQAIVPTRPTRLIRLRVKYLQFGANGKGGGGEPILESAVLEPGSTCKQKQPSAVLFLLQQI